MFFSISLLLVLVSKTLQQTSTPALTQSHPYRIGSKSLIASDLTINGTYLVNFDLQYPTSTQLMPALLSISNMDFLNNVNSRIFFSIDPKNYNSNDNLKFSFQVKLGPTNSYFTVLKVKYLVAIANDKILLPIYIYTNQKQLILTDNVNQLKVYNQQLVPEEPCIPIPLLGCVLSGVVNLLNSVTSAIGIPLTDGLGGSLSNSSASPYTTIEVKTFITKLDFTYSGTWTFETQSKSTNISNLSFNVTCSNSITGTPSYNFSVLIRNISYSLAGLGYKFDSGTFKTVSESYWSLDEQRLSFNLLFGISAIKMTSGNTNKKINFLLEPTSAYFLEYSSGVVANSHVFPVLGFLFVQCIYSPHLNLMFDTQMCYDSCPSLYYSNASKYCVKCVTPCKTCSSQTYCITCLPVLRLVPVSGSCVPCSNGYYFDDTILTCQPCKTGCTTCDNYTHCTSCSVPMKLVLVNYDCVSCQTTKYFKYDSSLQTSTCQNCPSGCFTCQNDSYCESCYVNMKRVLVAHQCVGCSSSEYFLYDSTLDVSSCESCPLGCSTCQNDTYCETCYVNMKRILAGNLCVECSSSEYFLYDSSLDISSCQSCPNGCSTCQNQSYCQSCYVNMKLTLVAHQCISCSNSQYFLHDSLINISSCQDCPTGCLTCDNLSHCFTCDAAMQLVIVNNQCVPCSNDQYFKYDPASSTYVCQDCPTGCTSCNNQSYCPTCNSSLKYYHQDDFCYQCNYISKFYNNQTQNCQPCHEGCLNCSSFQTCIDCDWKHQYQLRSSHCYKCVPPTIFTRARKCQYLYQQEVALNQLINILRICSKFNVTENDTVSTQKLVQDYFISLFIDDVEQQYVNLTIDSTQKLICFDYQIISSFTNQKINVIYHNRTNTDRIINPEFVNIASGSHINTFEENIYDIVKGVLDILSDGSGVAAPILFLSSGISFFMGFIEFAEITSLYIYTQAPIPYNLKVFLETIIQAQSFPLLPFTIPNPMQNNPLIVPQKQIYTKYQFDQYFLRGNLIMVLETLIYVSLYLALCLGIHYIKSKNLFARFFYKQFVSRCYSNCALSLEVVQIILVFSASVAFSSHGYANKELILNSITGLLFVLAVLISIMVNMMYLYRLKTVRIIDTEDIYPAIERNRKGAEMYTCIRLLCLLSIALLIPLVHYVYVVLMALSLLSAQVWYLFKKNIHKYRVQNWIRILHTSLFMLFNLIYIPYFLIDKYFNDMNIDIKLRIGNISMISLLCIYVCDLLLALIDIGDKVYQKLTNVFCKKKVIEDKIEERNAKEVKILEEKEMRSEETNYKTNIDSDKLIEKRAKKIKVKQQVSRNKIEAERSTRDKQNSSRGQKMQSTFSNQQYLDFPSNDTSNETLTRKGGIRSQKTKHRRSFITSPYKQRPSARVHRQNQQPETIKQMVNLEADQVMFPTTDRKARAPRSKREN